MTAIFNFDRDVVYAPGMTCLCDQLFAEIFSCPWKAYRFKKRGRGFRLYGAASLVIENLFAGETTLSATLFAEPHRFLEDNGQTATYNVFVVDSHWLLYRDTLFNEIDWTDLRSRLDRYRDRRLVFVDSDYRHYGYLQDISLVRTLTSAELQDYEELNEVRHRLLDIFTRFDKFRYVSLDALLAYHGYKTACVDQIDHYTAAFCELFRNVFVSYSDESEISKRNSFAVLKRAVIEHDCEITILERRERFVVGDVILRLCISRLMHRN